MFRQSLIEQGVNYDPHQKFLIDFEFFLRVMRHCKAANLPDVLVKRRVRKESYFQSTFSPWKQNSRLVTLSRKAVQDFRLPVWHYAWPTLRLGYPLVPNAVKRRLRTANGLLEEDWTI